MAPGKYERNVRHNIFSAIKRIKYWNEFGDFTQWEQPKLWNVRENKTTRKNPLTFIKSIGDGTELIFFRGSILLPYAMVVLGIKGR